MFDVVESSFNMKLDVYEQSESQDPDTGAINKTWSFIKTVPCYAKAVVSNTTSSRSGDRQVFDNRYHNAQTVELRTTERLTPRYKITNIRDYSDTPLWIEYDYPSNTPTVFEVIGSSPLTDPFGNVTAYNTSIKRSENQQIGL